MGINGLLPVLKAIQKEKHIRDFKGRTAGVDALCWMIEYCVSKIKLLQVNGITPIVVFDGARLPMKKRIERERKKARQESRSKAEECLEKGDLSLAHRRFMEAVEITSLMVYRLAQVLKQMSVQYIVAPYEADSQLAYLFYTGKIDFVITEDSDLLAFGVRKVFFKMSVNGAGVEINLDNLSQCEQFKMKQGQQFTVDMLLKASILGGCDYLEPIKGVAFKKALKIVKEFKGDVKLIIGELISENYKIDDNYLHEFQRAYYTFKHQVIYDVDRKCQRYLQELPDIMEHSMIEYFGKIQDDVIARDIAEGRIDPDTLRPFDELASEQQLFIEKREDKVGSIKQMIEGFYSNKDLIEQNNDSLQLIGSICSTSTKLKKREEKSQYKDFSKINKISDNSSNTVKQIHIDSSLPYISHFSQTEITNEQQGGHSIILSQYFNMPSINDQSRNFHLDIIGDQNNTMQPLLKEIFEPEVCIVKTIKKKSFLQNFISPTDKLQRETQSRHSQHSQLSREPPKTPPFMLRNSAFKVNKLQASKKVNVGQKRAAINNTKINDFFKMKE